MNYVFISTFPEINMETFDEIEKNWIKVNKKQRGVSL